jgi:hypothetical protein
MKMNGKRHTGGSGAFPFPFDFFLGGAESLWRRELSGSVFEGSESAN